MMERRSFLQLAGATSGGLILPGGLTAVANAAEAGRESPGRLASTRDDVPRTGFEQRRGDGWTLLDEELEFLSSVAALSDRVDVDVVGESVQGRPLHLVRIGVPQPTTTRNRRRSAALWIGAQHGNEPAGREAMLIALRDLAFTDNAMLVQQMRAQQMLVIPTANPDGRAANDRENSNAVDLNRDYFSLTQPETRAIQAVALDWDPDVVVDHHEYRNWGGPVETDVRYLWPRNLNTDPAVRRLARSLCEDYIARGARREGWTADEYWRHSVGPHGVYFMNPAGATGNTGAMGLRHSLGVTFESVRDGNLEDYAGEDMTSPANKRDRVARHVQAVEDTLRFLRDCGRQALRTSTEAALLAARDGADRSRPTYWGGADNDPPADDEIDDPPPCHYELTRQQADQLSTVLALHGIRVQRRESKFEVPMGQATRPAIPLLLDERSDDRLGNARPVYGCE
ncbi:MAG: carboxypeptidase [Actinophytocola sp.]|nr:carboxypeptidase [Actinophytocola sp.]